MVSQSAGSGTGSGSLDVNYGLLLRQAQELWENGLLLYANLANISALLKQFLERTNWVGFYLWDASRSELVLGPLQRLPACMRIALGKGVCGAAVSTRSTQLVPDIHKFPGHIACDSASNSEIVVPILRRRTVLGVLDVDSPEKSRFDAADQAGPERLVATLVRVWPKGG